MTSVLYHFKNTLPCWPGLRFFPRSWGVGRCGGGGATSTLGQALQAVSLGSGPDRGGPVAVSGPCSDCGLPQGLAPGSVTAARGRDPCGPCQSPPPPGPVFLICK